MTTEIMRYPLPSEKRLTVDSQQTAITTMKPALVLIQAREAAEALIDVVKKKTRSVMLDGEQYLEYEDWQTVGQFYRYGVKTGDAVPVDINGVRGARAHADLINLDTGEIFGGADAYCMRDEEKWNTRPKYEWQDDPNTGKRNRVHVGDEMVPWFQLASMAQTRAGAKAYRNRLAWVVVLAGYRPTPAEEIVDLVERGVEKHQRPHWCHKHKTAWFKTGKMKAFAHPVTGTKDWCYEPQAEQAAKIARPEVSAGAGQGTQTPAAGNSTAPQKPPSTPAPAVISSAAAPGVVPPWPEDMPAFKSWAEFQAYYKRYGIEGSEVMQVAEELTGRAIKRTTDFASFEEAWETLVEIATRQGWTVREIQEGAEETL